MSNLASLKQLAAAFLVTLLPFVLVAGEARAQTIENTAFSEWVLDGETRTGQSNTVSLDVAPLPPEIRTFAPTPSGSGQQVTFNSPLCGSSQSTAAAGSTSATQQISASIVGTSTYTPGQDVIFEIRAAQANLDSSLVDSLVVIVQTSTGDREELTVYETANDSGVFIGSIGTLRMPPAVVQGDCELSIADGTDITIAAQVPGNDTIIVQTEVDVLADPFGVVFDSETGEPVSGAVVTLVDAVTGQPATVFAEDGVTPWPSTVISGQPITDGAGNVYQMGPGEYWFPLTFLGQYRIEIEPPQPYTAPSVVSPEEIARLTRPDGRSFVIDDASYGGVLVLDDPNPVQIDIPVDRPSLEISLSKNASRQKAQPGDAVFYTIVARNADPDRIKRNVVLTDRPSRWLRLNTDSIRVDGQSAADAVTVTADGRILNIALGDLRGGESRRITYAMVVRADAPPTQAINRAETVDSVGRTNFASASIDIERDSIAGRMTIIGRVTAGDCTVHDDRVGIPGVRVMLEDGSFAITDIDGRYHFEGVVPGTHVVQAARMTLPKGGEFVDCTRSTRNAGSTSSQFVIGQGGSLVEIDFHATIPAEDAARFQAAQTEQYTPVALEGAVTGAAVVANELVDDAGRANGPSGLETTSVEAAPAEQARTDWLALGDGPDGWLTPEANHNPRAPAIKVAFRHRKGQTINLYVDGEPVDPYAFDGVKTAPDAPFAVSMWRGIPLADERTVLKAEIVNSMGGVNETLTREVYFVSQPARVELLREQSVLVADGVTRPVVTVRLTDRNGRPVREGVSGDFTLNEPFQSASQLEMQQLRQLTGIGSSSARWVIEGTDGLAKIELAPTMVSGSLRLEFAFNNGTIERREMVDAWVEPGDIEWTIVGLAEGSLGARTVADQMERDGNFDSDLGDKARVAFYAKGRVLGKYLVTMAYDSAKQREDQRVLGALDPDAYYTVFADASSRRFDAPSREKLYVRIETSTFFALYGDYETGFDETQLARYQRTATGVKAEARLGAVKAKGFVAKIGTRFRRDEIQGNGLSGPYALGSRNIVANSETVTIEVRDRFRSELIVSSRTLTRFIDYDIDVLSGAISFAAPVSSRDFDLNPQFIVIDYETVGVGGGEWNGGARVDWTDKSGTIRIGATGISDRGDGARTNLGGLDLRARLGTGTEIRAEIAMSKRDGEESTGWLFEAHHQTGKLDVLAYARSAEQEYGVGQQNGAELGRRKFGFDARYEMNEQFSVVASAWQDDSLSDITRRRAVQAQLAYRTGNNDVRFGISNFNDRLADGSRNTSTVVEAGASQRLLDNRLELSASTSVALDGPESIDLPARHRFEGRFALTQDVKLVGTYEIADGENIDARTARVGFEIAPWAGGRVVTTVGQQNLGELGPRSFAAFGLAQTLQVSPTLTLDMTLDGSTTLDGTPDVADVVNVNQPVASGGVIGQDGTLFEDFTAVTVGGAWRKDRWSATARAEYRDGEFADRKGFTFGALRQLGEGSVVGTGATWTKAEAAGGASTEIFDASLAFAHRPDESEVAVLGKLEYRSDAVTGAIAGETGPAGRTALLVDGDAKSRRLIASVSTNWMPEGEDDDGLMTRRDEFGLFLGARYNFDRFEGFDLEGFTALAGADARIGLGERIEIGGSATVRANLDSGTTSFAVGPHIGFVPADGVLLTLGYNVTGFRDEDFSASRNTDRGVYVSVRAKFDADTFSFLGLGR